MRSLKLFVAGCLIGTFCTKYYLDNKEAVNAKVETVKTTAKGKTEKAKEKAAQLAKEIKQKVKEKIDAAKNKKEKIEHDEKEGE